MSIKASDAVRALKLIKMPAPKAKEALAKVVPQNVGKAAKGDKFVANVQSDFNRVATKSVGAGAVGRSVVARAGTQGKPESKARSVVRVYDALDSKGKIDVLVAAVRTGLGNTDNNFSDGGNTVKA